MEAQQCAKLTGTNRSIGLVVLISQCPSNQFIPTLFFAGLVAMSRCPNPIPSRTRSLNASEPMVLRLKTRKSRSLPGLPRTEGTSLLRKFAKARRRETTGGLVSCQGAKVEANMHRLISEKRNELADVCRQYHVKTLEVFGSAARAQRRLRRGPERCGFSRRVLAAERPQPPRGVLRPPSGAHEDARPTRRSGGAGGDPQSLPSLLHQ